MDQGGVIQKQRTKGRKEGEVEIGDEVKNMNRNDLLRLERLLESCEQLEDPGEQSGIINIE